MNLNKAFVLGNVTRDPEVRSLPSGQQVANFGIATNRFYTSSSGEKKQDAEFHNIVCFGKLADIASRYLNKGSLVLIEGRIQTRSWNNAQGTKQYKTEIVAESLQLGPKGTGVSGGNSNFKNQNNVQDSQSIKQGEIPVIEENYMSPNNDYEEQNKISLDEKASDEIDVKDIPF